MHSFYLLIFFFLPLFIYWLKKEHNNPSACLAHFSRCWFIFVFNVDNKIQTFGGFIDLKAPKTCTNSNFWSKNPSTSQFLTELWKFLTAFFCGRVTMLFLALPTDFFFYLFLSTDKKEHNAPSARLIKWPMN